MKHKLASWVSILFNPFVLGVIVIILIANYATSSFSESLRWTVAVLAMSVVPVFVVVLIMVKKKKLTSFFNNPREQRTLVYVIAAFIGTIALIILWVTNAPVLIKATFVTGIVALIVFGIINIYWKISLHTGFTAASAAILAIIWGIPGLLTFLLVPLVAWSRIVLQQHTPKQVVSGGLAAAAIVAGIFRAFGIY